MTTRQWINAVREMAFCDIAQTFFQLTGDKVYRGIIRNYCSCGGTIHYSIVSGNLHMRASCDNCDFGFIE